MKTLIALLVTALSLSACGAVPPQDGPATSGANTPPAADDQARIDATLARLGKVCKNKLAEKYAGASMADIQVDVAATLRQSLDSGVMGLKDLQQDGASYNWSVPSKKASGNCDVDAKGRITQFTATRG